MTNKGTHPPTRWVVYCPAHAHFLVAAGVAGTTWTADRAEARRYDTKPAARVAAERATWADHTPLPWPMAEGTATL